MARRFLVCLSAWLAIGVLAFVTACPKGISEHRGTPVMEVSDKPFLTLEQQRQIVETGRTAVHMGSTTYIFDFRNGIPTSFRVYMWAYPE